MLLPTSCAMPTSEGIRQLGCDCEEGPHSGYSCRYVCFVGDNPKNARAVRVVVSTNFSTLTPKTPAA